MTTHHLKIFDVQHGACALLISTTENGVRWHTMIDCGHMNNARGRWFPGDYLRAQGIYVLDLLIISNLDEDHISGFPNLLQSGISISTIFSNPTVQPYAIRQLKAQYGMGAGIDAAVRELSRRGLATEIPWIPDVNIHCAWNSYPTAFEDENNLSVVTSLTFAGHRFLFTGDMECEGFNHLLRSYAPIRHLVQSVDVLVAPHHGRDTGICPDLFRIYGCRPKLVVISDDYMQYDTQQTSAFYRDKASGHPFKFDGNLRWVLTTRCDGTLDFMPTYTGLFVF